MKVLIVGGGGREHALAWKAAQSPKVSQVFVAPGNAGTALEPRTRNIAIAAGDVPALLEFAREQAVDLTIVGPEAPLVAGIVDAFEDAGLRCFGPSRAAARLEASKAFSKDFLQRHRIPTAHYRTFTDAGAAADYIRRHAMPIVIKADGLAAGKGVVIAHSEAEAIAAVGQMLSGDAFGEAGRQVVIEEFLQGEEASFIVIADGEQALVMASSQDHKARDDQDRGPNTGGMGAYSPAPVISDELHEHILRTVIHPTLQGMAAEGHRYRGFLYAGLMIMADGTAKVLEYNCRFGDPETQPIMLRLQSDLIELCEAALDGRLDRMTPRWDPRVALGVVMAAGGYPQAYRKGDVITGLPAQDSNTLKVFHAGTARQGDRIVTSGGRVLCVTALAENVALAQQNAYALVRRIDWNDVYYRSDIGYRAIARHTADQPSG
jgi:phosphoribosylamine--glycine ligase